MSSVLLRRRFGLGSLELFSHQCTFVTNYNKAADLTGRLAVRTYKYLTTSHLQLSASPAQIKLHTSHLMLFNRVTQRIAGPKTMRGLRHWSLLCRLESPALVLGRLENFLFLPSRPRRLFQ